MKIAIIPARGGSKRIPRKNIKDFLGKPVISYSIQAALDSGLFDEVMVSTDDEEIAKVAIQYGAKVPFLRSTETSNDFAGTAAVLEEVLNTYGKQGRVFDLACCLYPVAPLITVSKINEAYQLMNEKNLDCCFPICRYSSPIWRAFEMNNEKKIKMIWPENENKRTQDLPGAFFDAGQFYWFKTRHFLTTGEFITNETGAIVLDDLQSQDIDTITDWKIAELKFKLINEIT
jgi:pseudaminic acid cytidylyltransferase